MSRLLVLNVPTLLRISSLPTVWYIAAVWILERIRGIGCAPSSAAALCGREGVMMAVTTVQPCIATTVKCLEACEACFVECGTSGDREREKCAALARDCADLAALSLALMSRGSRYADDLCALHAEACRACADMCATFPQHTCCIECMAACRACAAECRLQA